MPWARMHDQARNNPKLRLLSDGAWRLYWEAVDYCNEFLTDGFLAAGMEHEFGVKAKNIPALVEELLTKKVPGKGPLWHRVDGGYRIHDFHDWNDSAEKIRRDRANSKGRVDRFRERHRNGVTDTVTHGQCSTATNTIGNGDGNGDVARSVRGTTYHVPQKYQKQEREPGSLTRPVDAVENPFGPQRINTLRRRRSKETDDGRPKQSTLTALACDVLRRHPDETDELELRALIKDSAARANLLYDGAAAALALEQAQAQQRKRRAS